MYIAHSFLDTNISFIYNEKSTLNSRNQPSLEIIYLENLKEDYLLNNKILRIKKSVVS